MKMEIAFIIIIGALFCLFDFIIYDLKSEREKTQKLNQELDEELKRLDKITKP